MAIRIDEIIEDAKTGRVYVRYAEGPEDAIPVKAKRALEFVSMAEMERTIAEQPSDTQLVIRALARNRDKLSDAIGAVETVKGAAGGR